MLPAMNLASTPPIDGAQTVDRACELLREVALHGAQGGRIVDLCHSTGLSRPTVHRILRSLAGAGLLRQHAQTRRYTLGSGLFELGLAAPNPVEAFPAVRGLAEELAIATGDTVYLMLRSYDDAVCAWRAEGAYPIKANVVALGDRRPLGASAAGLCILGSLPEAEAECIIDASAPMLKRFCLADAGQVRGYVAQARTAGHALSRELVMAGVCAVGISVPARHRRPYLALSVSAISARIPDSRVAELAAQLRSTADAIAAVIEAPDR
jgi:DNA-binding IclR family transcriptional regulator